MTAVTGEGENGAIFGYPDTLERDVSVAAELFHHVLQAFRIQENQAVTTFFHQTLARQFAEHAGDGFAGCRNAAGQFAVDRDAMQRTTHIQDWCKILRRSSFQSENFSSRDEKVAESFREILKKVLD